MKLGLTEKQLSKILSELPNEEEISEEEPVAAEPEAGTSATQSGGSGYPEVGKWESGVTRGPANQTGVTKWADVVGVNLKRGKANPLKEENITKKKLNELIEQVSSNLPWYDSKNGRLNVGLMKRPAGGINAKDLYPNIKDGKYPTVASMGDIKKYLTPNTFDNFSNKNDRLYVGNIYDASNRDNISKLFAKGAPNYWVGLAKPKPPVPYKGQMLSKPGTILPKQPWGHYEGKLGNLEDQQEQYQSDLTNWSKVNDKSAYEQQIRVTAKGRQVPEGFYPAEYDEYVEKITPLKSKLDYLYKTKFSDAAQMAASGSRRSSYTNDDVRLRDSLQKQIDSLTKEFFNKEYPLGISKANKKELGNWVNAINAYYKPLIADCEDGNTKRSEAFMKQDNTYVDKKIKDPCSYIRLEYRQKLKDIKSIYGNSNDNRTDFDKFWDEYGTIVQIGASLIVTFALPPLGVAMSEVLLADAALNLAIAGYQASRNQLGDAAASVLFAILPQIKLFKAPLNVTESIAMKLAKNTIRTSDDLAKFMIEELTSEEVKWFKIAITMNPKILEGASKEFAMKKIAQLESKGLKIGQGQKEMLNSKWLDKGMSKAKKLFNQNGQKMGKLPINVKPAVRKFVFDMVLIHNVREWIDGIQEKMGKRFDGAQTKRLENYFESIPKGVEEIYLKKSLTPKAVDLIAEGDLNSALDIVIDESLKNDQINPKTNKPYTKEESEKVNAEIMSAWDKLESQDKQ